MTTYEYGRSLLSETRERIRPRARAWAGAAGRVWRRFRPLTMPVAGTGCFIAAAFTYSVLSGLVVAGLGCFFVEWRAAK